MDFGRGGRTAAGGESGRVVPGGEDNGDEKPGGATIDFRQFAACDGVTLTESDKGRFVFRGVVGGSIGGSFIGDSFMNGGLGPVCKPQLRRSLAYFNRDLPCIGAVRLGYNT